MSTQPEILVMGGGPAGLRAAAAAARAGASVLLVDENDSLGGSLRYQAQAVEATPAEPAVGPAELLDALVRTATAAGATLQAGTIAAGWYPGGKVLLVEGAAARLVEPQAMIVASGSTDLPFPFAGATLPGVFTARAVQILLNQWRVLPGHRFAVIGPDQSAEDVTIDIAMAGGEVVTTGVAPAQMLRARGLNGVEQLQIGGDRFDVDCIVVAMGRQADPALATMAGTQLGFAPQLGGLTPIVGPDLQGAPGVFVAGDAAGACSVAVAIAEGRLAGTAAANWIGKAAAEDVAALQQGSGPEQQWRQEQRESLRPVHGQPYR